MHDFVRFLDDLARVTPLFLAIAAILGYFFREKIKQVLSRSLLADIEKIKHQLEKELADHSSQLQREVEAYKVTLIAESEKIKAAQDVKKSLALRMAERKFNCLFALLDAHMGFGTMVAALVTTTFQGNPEIIERVYSNNHESAMKRLQSYDLASSSAHAFLTDDQIGKTISLKSTVVNLLSVRPGHGSPVVLRENPDIVQLLRLSLEIERSLKQALRDMESVD